MTVWILKIFWCLRLPPVLTRWLPGLSLAFLEVDIIIAILYIMAVPSASASAGAILGRKLNKILKNKATMFGGLLLIFIGIKIIIDQISSLG